MKWEYLWVWVWSLEQVKTEKTKYSIAVSEGSKITESNSIET